MKEFAFTLERVRDWRARQVTLEQARLETIFAERASMEQRLALLEREARESAVEIGNARSFDATELQAVDGYRRYVASQRATIASKLAGIGDRIAAQQQRLIEARRKSELLAKLRDRKWKAWNAEFSREIEAGAGEAFLARWNGGRP